MHLLGLLLSNPVAHHALRMVLKLVLTPGVHALDQVLSQRICSLLGFSMWTQRILAKWLYLNACTAEVWCGLVHLASCYHLLEVLQLSSIMVMTIVIPWLHTIQFWRCYIVEIGEEARNSTS